MCQRSHSQAKVPVPAGLPRRELRSRRGEESTDLLFLPSYNAKGYENADKCAWTFGSAYPVGGAQAKGKLSDKGNSAAATS